MGTRSRQWSTQGSWQGCLSRLPKSYSSGKKKTNKHKHFGRDGVRDKQEPSLGQMGPLPGTKWDPSLGQTGLSLLNSTVKSPFCPVCPWDDCPARAVRKMFMCFLFIGFFAPKFPEFSSGTPSNRPPTATAFSSFLTFAVSAMIWFGPLSCQV